MTVAPAELAASATAVAGSTVPVRYRVAAVTRELADTATLSLQPVDAALAPCVPGQFNMLWGFGTGEVPISVSGDSAPGEPLVHTIRDVGPSTAALCALEAGAVVGLRGPFGVGWDLAAARGGDVVIVAGGIGLAPLRPAVLQILARRQDFRTVTLLVGARSPDLLLYRAQLDGWRRDGDLDGDLDVRLTVDAALPGWRGHVGVVTDLLPLVELDPVATSALVCGPEIMMRFVASALTDLGVAASRVQVSLERNMKCAVAHCGHCQLGPVLVCRDGPVFTYDVAGQLMAVRGL